MKLLASLGSFGLATWMFVASAVGAVPPAEKLLPPDTLLMLTVPDWDRATAAAKDFPLVQMWNDPAMKPFTYKFETKLREMIGEQDQNFKKDWPEFKALFGGQVTLALLRGDWPTEPGATPQLVFLMDVKDKAKALRDFIERWEKRDADAGKTIERETVRGVKFSRTRSNNGDGGANKSEPFAGQSGSLLLASESTKALETVLARLDGGGKTLEENAEFERGRSAVARDAQAFGWVNVKSLVGIVEKLPAQGPDGNPLGISPAKLVDALGIGGVDGVAFGARLAGEGTQVELFVQAPQARRKGLVAILAPEAKDAGPLPAIAGDVTKFTRMRLDGQKAFQTLERLLTDLNPQMAGIVTLMLENVGKDKDPSFDLRKQVFGNLGADFISVQKAPRGKGVDELVAAPTLVLIGSPKPDALLQALLTINPVPPKDREFLGRKIYTLGPLPGLPAPGGRPQAMHFASTAGYLLFATDAGMIEEALRGEPAGKPLSAVPGLAEAAQKVGGLNTGWFGYDNQTESLRGLFTTLKQNPDAFEKLLTSPIPTPNAPRPPVDQLKGLLDFSLLPPFDAVAKYFSFTVNAVASTPEGIAFKSFLPAPGGKE